MENNEEYTIMDIITRLSQDEEISPDPQVRAGLAFGLFGMLSTLVM